LNPRATATPRARAREVLEDLLTDGPLPYPEIILRAPAIPNRTLFRAKNDLKVHSIKIRRDEGNVSY
jgi:hypothetical protein